VQTTVRGYVTIELALGPKAAPSAEETVSLAFEKRVQIPDSVLTRELDGELVILDMESERYFGLDAVGSRIWSHLVDCRRVGDAFEATLAEFEVDRDRLSRDFEKLVTTLVESGLIELSDPA